MAEEFVPDVQQLRSQKARLIEFVSARALSCGRPTRAACSPIMATCRWKLIVFSVRKWQSCWVAPFKGGLKQHRAWSGCWRMRPCRKLSPPFMKDLPVNTASSERTKSPLLADYFGYFDLFFIYSHDKKETLSKRQAAPDPQDSVSANRICYSGGWCCSQSIHTVHEPESRIYQPSLREGKTADDRGSS